MMGPRGRGERTVARVKGLGGQGEGEEGEGEERGTRGGGVKESDRVAHSFEY